MTIKRMAAALALLTFSALAWAQAYPSKPVRLISTMPPGGGADAVARIIGQALSEQLGHQIVVDTRAGASGMIGTALAAKAVPDGYTMVLGHVAVLAILPASTPKLSYDALKDFQPISLVARSDYVLTVHPSLPGKTMKDIVALAKSNPGKLAYASSGNMSAPHLAGELLSLHANIKMLHVPYKGNGPAALAVMTGETTMLFGSGPSVVPHVTAGKLRAIATTGLKRSMPELPTVNETLPGFEVGQWYGLLVPAGVPKEIVERLNREIAIAVANPKIAQLFVNLGTKPETNSPEDFRTLIQSETRKWMKVLKSGNIRPD